MNSSKINNRKLRKTIKSWQLTLRLSYCHSNNELLYNKYSRSILNWKKATHRHSVTHIKNLKLKTAKIRISFVHISITVAQSWLYDAILDLKFLAYMQDHFIFNHPHRLLWERLAVHWLDQVQQLKILADVWKRATLKSPLAAMNVPTSNWYREPSYICRVLQKRRILNLILSLKDSYMRICYLWNMREFGETNYRPDGSVTDGFKQKNSEFPVYRTSESL